MSAPAILMALPPRWAGHTVVCIASGPSLTPEDCELVRAAGAPTVVTNTSFRVAPWADVLFGFDSGWWRGHLPEVLGTFKGRLMSSSDAAPVGVERIQRTPWFRNFVNSGCCAVSIAIGAGAARVVLIGYDCQFGAGGRKHWHDDHPKLSNCASLRHWPGHFKQVARYANERGVKVINASRQTALQTFDRLELETALERIAEPA